MPNSERFLNVSLLVDCCDDIDCVDNIDEVDDIDDIDANLHMCIIIIDEILRVKS
jgi:hypothetical protein